MQLRTFRFYCFLSVSVMLAFTIQAALCQGVVGRGKLTADMNEMLKHPNEIEVYSLDAKKTVANPTFHGWTVFGSTSIRQEQVVKAIGQQLIEKTDPESVTFCAFQPHHGVSIISNRHRLDYVICFQCRDILVFLDGKYWNHGRLDSPNIRLERLLNAPLQEHKIAQAADYLREFAARNR